ncbi:MAG: DUF1573 domain-containing protein [Gemmataceae bacterium]|nr:DUF1573 domain-containing protein [Gemmataceae bacterium]
MAGLASLQGGIVFLELPLGIWLISRRWPELARLAALAFFSGAFAFAFSQAMAGETSCGCFGRVQISPVLVLFLDLTASGGLLLWRVGGNLEVRGIGTQSVRNASAVVIGLALAVAFRIWSAGPESVLATPGIPEKGYRIVACNLGVVSPNSSVERVVPIPNDASVTGTIKGIWKDCGCIVHDLSKASANPGENWDLTFSYRASVDPGRISQRIVVAFKEEGLEPVLIHVRGMVRDWAEPSPGQIDFGDTLPSAATEKELTIVTGVDESFVLNPTVSGLSWVTVQLRGSEKVRHDYDASFGTLHRFRLFFAPPSDAPAASYRGLLTFTSTVSGLQLRVPCAARVLPKIGATPDAVFFGVIDGSTPKTCTIRLHCREEKDARKPLEFHVKHDLGSEFKATIAESAAPQEILLNVQISRSNKSGPGLRSGTLSVTTPDGHTLKLPVHAWFQ